ncbi:MAG: ATP-grasp domain-containing protein [Candidatus Nezhaarchaeota archaeon]|nr:ATP-grasp domain-containing protein [Candidatus Nezhaarchaeota archaeon]
MTSILIAEYFLSGGSARITSSLLLEGYAMVKALCEALSWIDWRVTVLVDERLLPYVDLRASRIIPVGPGLLFSVLREGLEPGLALTIAPPMDRAHALLVRALEEAGLKHLGPPSWKIEAYSDKYRQVEELSKKGVPTPKTEVVGDPLPREAKELSSIGLPLILKPRLGAGCEGLLVAETTKDLEEAIAKGLVGEGYLAQEVLRGIHASASVFSDGLEAWAPCLNAQLIRWGQRPSYEGGFTPLSHPMAERALRIAEEAVKALGLEGYVGVDLVLTDSGAYVVEVNPRPTTSIVSLLEVLGRGFLGTLLASLSLRSLSSLVKSRAQGGSACAFIKAKSPAKLYFLPNVMRERLSAMGVYAATPLAGWVEAGEPVAVVKAVSFDADTALLRAWRLKDEVESLLMASRA